MNLQKPVPADATVLPRRRGLRDCPVFGCVVVLQCLSQFGQRIAHPRKSLMDDGRRLRGFECVQKHSGVSRRQIREAADDWSFTFRNGERHSSQCSQEQGNRLGVVALPERGMACLLQHIDLGQQFSRHGPVSRGCGRKNSRGT